MTTRNPLRFALYLAAVATFVATVASASGHEVRVGVLKFGTVHWELDVIQTHELARKQGIDLQIVKLGSKRATAVALQGGAADVIVTDWIWVSRQRGGGAGTIRSRPIRFRWEGSWCGPTPGSRSWRTWRAGRSGIAGGPVDKSWLLLQAYAKRGGLDLSRPWSSRRSARRRC